MKDDVFLQGLRGSVEVGDGWEMVRRSTPAVRTAEMARPDTEVKSADLICRGLKLTRTDHRGRAPARAAGRASEALSVGACFRPQMSRSLSTNYDRKRKADNWDET